MSSQDVLVLTPGSTPSTMPRDERDDPDVASAKLSGNDGRYGGHEGTLR